MSKYLPIIIQFTFLLSVFFSEAVAKKPKIPKHPSKLSYKPLEWNIPLGSPYRTTLSNGLRLYIAEDQTLPLVTISGYFKAGSINDPPGKKGLGGFAAHLMRTAGTQAIPSDTLDALIDHYALSISLSLSETMLTLKAQFLSQFTDTALYILDQILFHPAFEKEKIEKERVIALQQIKHRFDNPEPVVSAAYKKVIYPDGENSILSSEASMQAITRKDLAAFHKAVIRTENVILSVSGDFNKKSMIEKLEQMFPKTSPDSDTTSFPAIAVKPAVKFLIVHKEISQAHVRLGLPLFKRPHPDYYPLSVFNHVLGGGGFTSRLGTTVRSDAGLTYSIYSRVETNYIFPATVYINFFTQHATVNKAIALTLHEVEKIVTEGITKDELANAKKVLIDGLPSMFRSKDDIVGTYAWNEYYKRSDDHYTVYPDKINALTLKDITRASQKYIKPSAFTFLIVADTTQLFKAEKADGFSIQDQSDITVIPPDKLYDLKLFVNPK